MTGLRIRGATLLVAFLAVLLQSAVSSATPGRTFYDTRNETADAPDIGKVTITQEGDIVQVEADVARLPALFTPGFCGFALDTDGDPTTGSLFGAEYFFAIDLKTLQGQVEHWTGTRYVNAKKIADPSRSLVGAGSCGFMFNLANFGWPKEIRLTIAVTSGSGPSASHDLAPDAGEWRFAVVQQPDSLEFTFEPSRPATGTTFAAVAPSLTLTDESVVKPSRVTCTATLDGANLPALGGTGKCRWHIPVDAAGKQLVVTATAGYRGRLISYDPWKFRIG